MPIKENEAVENENILTEQEKLKLTAELLMKYYILL